MGGKRWTSEELCILASGYENGIDSILHLFNCRSRKSLIEKAHKLGLNNRKLYSDHQILKARRLVSDGAPPKVAAFECGIALGSIYKVLYRERSMDKAQ